MNAKHPPMEQWLAWIEGGPLDEALGSHLESCSSCRALVEALRAGRRARTEKNWRRPPDELVERALGVFSEKRLGRGSRRSSLPWQHADVRHLEGGAGLADVSDAQIVAGSCPGGEVSVLVHPPAETAAWRFEARVWLHAPKAGQGITLALVHDDHVVARIDADEGRMVRFEEVVPAGWMLEIHMPAGDVVVLSDPFESPA